MYLKYFLYTWIILELVVLTTCALKLKYKVNLGVQIEFIKCMNALLFYAMHASLNPAWPAATLPRPSFNPPPIPSKHNEHLEMLRTRYLTLFYLQFVSAILFD